MEASRHELGSGAETTARQNAVDLYGLYDEDLDEHIAAAVEHAHGEPASQPTTPMSPRSHGQAAIGRLDSSASELS